MEPIGAPHISRIFDIEEEWIDYNGHLNMAYYTVLFDRASDEVSERLGMGPAYAKARRLTTYTAEIHHLLCAGTPSFRSCDGHLAASRPR